MDDNLKLLIEARKIITTHLRASHKDFLVRSADQIRRAKAKKDEQ